MPDEIPRLPIATRRQVLRAVGGLLIGRRWRVSGILVLLLVAAASTLVLPLTIGWLVDTVAANAGGTVPEAFWWQVGTLAAAAVVGGAVELVGVVALGSVVNTMAAELREQFVAAALALPAAEVERVGVGDIVTRAATDTRNVSDELPAILPVVASAGFTIVLAVAGTAVIDGRFTIAFLLAVPLYALALRWYLPAVPPVYAALRSADSTRGERVLSTLAALPTVTAFSAGTARITAIRAATWDVARWEVRARIMQNRFFGRINLAEAVGLLVVLGTGFALASFAEASLGAITAASLLFLQVTGPLAALLYVMDDVQSAAASLARVVGVTRLSSGVTASTAAPGPGDDVLRVENVRFEYQAGHPVLNGVSLALAAGEHLAIVGSSGSGKTTLARLIAGVRAPTSGRIRIAIDRSRVASLDQESHVFATSLRENLRLAAPGATDDELREALGRANAAHLLAALPDGLDTVLGTEGHRLVAADAQLISLARLMLRDPVLAILDEATAEADSRSAALLQEATSRVLRGRAAIVIAHRLSQACACDRIVVLEHGRVIEQGTHHELVARGGRYAELWAVYSG